MDYFLAPECLSNFGSDCRPFRLQLSCPRSAETVPYRNLTYFLTGKDAKNSYKSFSVTKQTYSLTSNIIDYSLAGNDQPQNDQPLIRLAVDLTLKPNTDAFITSLLHLVKKVLSGN